VVAIGRCGVRGASKKTIVIIGLSRVVSSAAAPVPVLG
jgi:hypothetical protein